MKWFRFYHEALDDPKVQRLRPELFKHWVNLLCLAARYEGTVPRAADAAFSLRLSLGEYGALLLELQTAGLLDEEPGGLRPHNWSGRQYASDDVTARTQKHRSKAATQNVPSINEARSGNVPRNVPRNDLGTETEPLARAIAPVRAPATDTDTDPDTDPDLGITHHTQTIARAPSEPWRAAVCGVLSRSTLKPWERTALADAEREGYSLAALQWALAEATAHATNPNGLVAYALTRIADAPTAEDSYAQEPGGRLRAHPRHSDARGEIRPPNDVGDYERLYVDAATYLLPDVPGPGIGESPPPEPDRREHPGV